MIANQTAVAVETTIHVAEERRGTDSDAVNDADTAADSGADTDADDDADTATDTDTYDFGDNHVDYDTASTTVGPEPRPRWSACPLYTPDPAHQHNR